MEEMIITPYGGVLNVPVSWALGSRALEEILLPQMVCYMTLLYLDHANGQWTKSCQKERNLGATLKTYVHASHVVFSNLIGPVNIPTALLWTGIWIYQMRSASGDETKYNGTVCSSQTSRRHAGKVSQPEPCKIWMCQWALRYVVVAYRHITRWTGNGGHMDNKVQFPIEKPT